MSAVPSGGAARHPDQTPAPDLTRSQLAVLTAYVALIEELGTDDVPFRLIARRSGVAERTVYRSYPTRAQLLAATAAWLEATVFAREPAASVFDLPLTVRESMRGYAERPELAHVVAETTLRTELEEPPLAPSEPAAARLVREELVGTEDSAQGHLAAALTHLDSAATWVVLRRELQMDDRDAADAAAWAAEVVLQPSRWDAAPR
ncbi:helix-turn-helix transcriptional regulator [Streptomyces sp. NP160]|uniref:TetR/AcrR family transcriptional regulator n=1 Tax=Streptomyces sp. NP160 TaxID=2586637 RepID=UPI00111B875C|nr:helix-turn-helix domain-containing protein [Streptomyces sp. NP160]TNM67644.1 helix-turn-helix transcriptional regulator [Streptomyces sp. NP160]